MIVWHNVAKYVMIFGNQVDLYHDSCGPKGTSSKYAWNSGDGTCLIASSAHLVVLIVVVNLDVVSQLFGGEPAVIIVELDDVLILKNK